MLLVKESKITLKSYSELNNKKTHLLGVSIKLSDSKYLEVLMGKDGSFNLEHTDRPMNSMFYSEVNPKKHSRKSVSLENNHNNNSSISSHSFDSKILHWSFTLLYAY